MGAQGFCRIRPVHVAALLKRYRELLGEMGYYERPGRPDEARLVVLRQFVASLGQALRLLDPAIALDTERPIRYRPSEPLPDAALARAILAAFQMTGSVAPAVMLAKAIATAHSLHFHSNDEWHRFVMRMRCTTSSLAKRGLIPQAEVLSSVLRSA